MTDSLQRPTETFQSISCGMLQPEMIVRSAQATITRLGYVCDASTANTHQSVCLGSRRGIQGGELVSYEFPVLLLYLQAGGSEDDGNVKQLLFPKGKRE